MTLVIFVALVAGALVVPTADRTCARSGVVVSSATSD